MGLINWTIEKPVIPVYFTGWMEEDTLETIKTLGEQYDFKTILEIGTYCGLSSKAFLDANLNAELYCVDTWTAEWSAIYNAVAFPREQCIANLWEYRNRVELIQLPSTEGTQWLFDRGIKPDMIFIDGDHSYDGVYADLNLCLELFPDSFTWGHDFTWESVRCAMQDTCKKWGFKFEDKGNTWFIDKGK